MQKETALFNEKTIKRLCSKTKITAKQKKAAKAWLEKLESDSLRKEKKHYFEFRDELGKLSKTELSLQQQSELMDLFDTIKKEVLVLLDLIKKNRY
jgi:uncharacterized protein YeaO (DUF488 family)